MVFFANSQGVIVTSTNSPLNRGSNLANEIVLVAPFTTLTSVTMQYKTPDGVISALISLTPMEWSTPEAGETAPKLNAWKVNVDSAMTELTGDLTFQFFLYYPQDGQSVRLATTEAVVRVNRGTFTVLEEDTPAEDVVQQLVGAYNTLIEQYNLFAEGANAAVYAAEEAEASATAAAGSATTASAAAGRAEAAQQRAETAETNAETAETNAKAARTGAEAARAAAETAENNAEAAQAGAEAARAAVEQALQFAITDYATDITASINGTSYIININLLNSQGTVISTASVDLPLESVVVGGSYANGNIILTLKNGGTVSIPVTDLIDGLVSEETFNAEVARLDGNIGDARDAADAAQATADAAASELANPVDLAARLATARNYSSELGKNALGVVTGSANYGYGITVITGAIQGMLGTVPTTDKQLEDKTGLYNVIGGAKLDKAVMEGLGNNALTWSDAYKAKACKTIGATQLYSHYIVPNIWVATQNYSYFNGTIINDSPTPITADTLRTALNNALIVKGYIAGYWSDGRQDSRQIFAVESNAYYLLLNPVSGMLYQESYWSVPLDFDTANYPYADTVTAL